MSEIRAVKREPNGPYPKGENGGAHGVKGRSGGLRTGKAYEARKAYLEQRAAELASDPTVWDVQLARAQCGDLKSLQFAADRAFGTPQQSLDVTSGGKPLLLVGRPK